MEFIRSDIVEAHVHGSIFPLLQKHGVAGAAVCIFKAGAKGFTLTRSYGYSSLEDDKTVDACRTWFDLGSCARLLAALTALRLIEERRIPLSSDVNKHLPAGVKVHTQHWGPVTLHHLLSHTSGLVASTREAYGGGSGFAAAAPVTGIGGPVGALPPRHGAGRTPNQLQDAAPDSAAQFLGQLDIRCDVAPGSVYSPADIDAWLLAAVAEALGGGACYSQLARTLVTEPLGIALGQQQDVRCYSHPARASPAPAPASSGQEALTPVSGLVLTAQGAAKLLGALVPLGTVPAPRSPAPASEGALTPRGRGSPAPSDAAVAGLRQPGSVLTSSSLQQMYHVHFVDTAKELPVGYLMSCPPMSHTSNCFYIDHSGGSGSRSASGSAGAASRSLSGSCQAALVVLPHSGVGVCILANTAEPAGSGGGGGGFCQQALSPFLERFRPLQEAAATVRPWLLSVQPARQDAVLQLFCFPPAGVLPSAFDQWAAGLPEYIRVRTVQLPGRSLRKSEKSVCRISKISAPIADAIAALIGGDTQFALWGHGLGALCAFEAARHLEGCHRRPPLHLFVSGCASPDTWPSNDHPGKRYTPWAVPKDSARHLGLAPSTSSQQRPRGGSSSGAASSDLGGGARRLRGLQDGEGEEEEEELFYYAHELPDNKLVGLLAACARTPKSWRKEAEAMQEHLAMLRPDLEAEESYVYRLPPVRGSGTSEGVLASIRSRSETEVMARSCHLSCPLTVLRGDQDTSLMPPPATSGGPDALSVARPGQPPALMQGWSKMSSSQPVSFVTIPGSHSYWEEDCGRVTLLAKMAQVIGRQLTVHTPWLPSKPVGRAVAGGKAPAVPPAAPNNSSGGSTPRGGR